MLVNAISNPPESIFQQFLGLFLPCKNVTHFCLNTAHLGSKINFQIMVNNIYIKVNNMIICTQYNLYNCDQSKHVSILESRVVHMLFSLNLRKECSPINNIKVRVQQRVIFSEFTAQQRTLKSNM